MPTNPNERGHCPGDLVSYNDGYETIIRRVISIEDEGIYWQYPDMPSLDPFFSDGDPWLLWWTKVEETKGPSESP